MANNILLQDVWQITFRTRANDQIGLNVCHYRCTLVVTGGVTDVELASYMAAVAAPAYQALMTPSASYESTTVFRVLPAAGYMPFTSLIAAGPGIIAGDMVPRQVAGILTKTTAYAGRAFRGRVYVPFVPESMNDVTGVPTTPYITKLTNLGGVILNPFTVVGGTGSATFQPSLFHRAGLTTTDIIGFRSNSKFATQRRRGSYGRVN